MLAILDSAYSNQRIFNQPNQPFKYCCETENFEGHWKYTIFEDIGKMTHSNNTLIRFAKVILTVLSNAFHIFFGMLLYDIAFLQFKILIFYSILSEKVVLTKESDWRGSVRKSEK